MRRRDWPERLAAFLEDMAAEPFAYGTHDCCQFAGRCVEAMTGENPASAWVYHTQTGALRFMARGLDRQVTQALGDPIMPARAGRGDVVMAELENGETVGICLGRWCAFATDPGITLRPRSMVRLAWRVG